MPLLTVFWKRYAPINLPNSENGEKTSWGLDSFIRTESNRDFLSIMLDSFLVEEMWSAYHEV